MHPVGLVVKIHTGPAVWTVRSFFCIPAVITEKTEKCFWSDYYLVCLWLSKLLVLKLKKKIILWLKLRRYVLIRHKTNLIDETSIIIFFRNQAVQMRIKRENCTSKEKSGNFVMMWAYMDGMGVVHYSSYREVTLQVSKKILWVVSLMAKRPSIQCSNLLAIKEILLATVSSLIATSNNHSPTDWGNTHFFFSNQNLPYSCHPGSRPV